MIIACPNCTGPYQLPDDQVAALVQVQCPHCEYRVILDFEAANDPSLREPEMLLADGFRSADDYEKALADGHTIAKYDLPKAPAPTPRAPTTPPVAARPTLTPEARPQATPVESIVSGSSLSDKPGSLAAAVQDFSRPEPEPEPVAAKPTQPEKTFETPAAERPAEKPVEKPVEPVDTKPEHRIPPHTPPLAATAKESPTPELRPSEGKPIEPAAESGKRPVEKAPEKAAEKQPEKTAEPEGRGAGIVLVVVILIIAALILLTYFKTGSFNPMLLLKPSG